jgi:hypothetical protein
MPRLFEAMALAEIGGFRRALVDAHPSVAAMVARLRPAAGNDPLAATAPGAHPSALASGVGALLTPKEAHILGC